MKPEFIRKKLKNGLTILFEKRNNPVVSVSAAVKEGSAYENEEKKGVSHFIEHLMFKGTKNKSQKEIAGEIEKKGGVLNAFTGEELTCYWSKLPSKYFPAGINIVKDLILNPRFNPVEFEKEKRVILEEIKMYYDNPALYVLNKIKSLLYKKPFGLSALGDEKKILKMKREDVIRYFQDKYTTNKMILCVVGNACIEEIEDYGKSFPRTKAGEEKIKAIKINKQIVEKRKGLEQAHLVLGFHTSNAGEKERYANEIFNAILAVGMSSRLFEEIREKRGLAYDIKGILEQGKNYGYNVIYTGTGKEKIKECKEIILKEIKKLKNLEKKDFDEAKEQLIGLRKVESEESINVMSAFINEEIAGNAREFYMYDKRISNVKLEEVRKLSKIKNYSSIILIPK